MLLLYIIFVVGWPVYMPCRVTTQGTYVVIMTSRGGKRCLLFDDSSNSTFATLGLNVNHLLVVQSVITIFKSFGIIL